MDSPDLSITGLKCPAQRWHGVAGRQSGAPQKARLGHSTDGLAAWAASCWRIWSSRAERWRSSPSRVSGALSMNTGLCS